MQSESVVYCIVHDNENIIKTGDVEVLEFYHDLVLLDRDDMMAVINDMIQAAKNGGK